MNILIIGASGLVGGNLYQLLSKIESYQVIGTYNNFETENLFFLNASAKEGFPDWVYMTKWKIIIHTGALTNVDLCEEDPDKSRLLTVDSTLNLIELAKVNKSKFIYISTDYVFDGNDGPYSEDAPVNPLSIYGKHKLDAENLVKILQDYLIIRITNVYGLEERNKNFLSSIVNDLKKDVQKSVAAPIDQFASPINALDVAKAIQLLIKDNKTGLYHLSSTDYLSRVQYCQIIKKYFPNLSIKGFITNNGEQKAKRPSKGGLNAEKFILEYPSFHFSNLDDYISKL
jgi:dTDP-4-dehydrorhamnose reductase